MSSFFPLNLDELRVLKPEADSAMPRQDVFDAHGHDMHPQALQRLSGSGDQPGGLRPVRPLAREIMARVISGF